MNVRTGELAADVAFEWASIATPPVALILGYNGAARPTMARVDEWGRPFLCGFESVVDRATAGGDAGEADAAYSCSRFDEMGYARELGSWVCAADTTSTAPWLLGNVTEYGRRYALRMIAGGRSGPLTAYGNPAAVEALCAGIRAAGLVALRWGVGTWGYGESGGGIPPSTADAELIQSGNNPGPVPGTDLNWLYVPVSTFAPYGAAPETPAPPAPTEGTMEILVGQLETPKAWGPIPVPAHTQVALLFGPTGRIMGTWAGDGPFGIPQGAVDWKNAGGRAAVDITFVDPAMLAQAIDDQDPTLEAQRLAAIVADAVGGGGGTPVDLEPARQAAANIVTAANELVAALQ